MKLSSVSIAKDHVHWPVSDIPHITYCDGYQPKFLSDEAKSLERVEYLAKRRNDGVQELLKLYPETTHILMVDSHYCNQEHELRQLLCDYWDSDEKTILGGSTWFHSQYWPHRKRIFWDSWTTPEGLTVAYSFNGRWRHNGSIYQDGGFLKVRAVGGAMIFPRTAWETHPFDSSFFPWGSEINGMCENSGLPVYVDFYARFWHPEPPRYGIVRTLKARTLKPLRKRLV